MHVVVAISLLRREIFGNSLEQFNIMVMSASKYQIAIAILSTVIGTMIGSVGVGEVFSRPPNVDTLLRETSNELNKKLPMMLDKETRLDTTIPAPNKTFIYKYTLINILAKDYNGNLVKSKIRPIALRNYKTNPSMKPFRDLSVNLKYQYFDKKGTFFMSFDISPKDF